MNARATQEAAATSATVGSLQQLGQKLREAREARGVNLEEVAARLRLGTRTIRSMEAGNFEELPAATYARGYLRAYANFLRTDPVPLLQAYDQYADKPPELNPFASSPPPQIQATDLPIRAVTYGVSALVVALLGIWLWQTQQFNSIDALSVPKWGGEAEQAIAQPITEPVQTMPGTDAVPPPSAAAVSPPSSQVIDGIAAAAADNAAADPLSGSTAASPAVNGAEANPSTTTAAVDAIPGTNDDAAASAASVVGDTVPGNAGTPAAPAADVGLAVNAPGMQVVPAAGEIPYATPPSTTDAAGSQAEAAAVGVATGPQALSFDLAEDSWLEVYDAENKRLYYNIGKQGTRVSVQGLLPYSVKVGNAPAVLVSYQGHSLDITAFSTGSVARFQVTPDGFLAQP